jgi:class 3 adenylate cyclase/tetratricopeptide (TPR) repeat protein
MNESAREVRKTVTILFCDLVHSTGLAEGDPEAYRRVQTRFFDRMRAIVERHGGTVEKFIGDEVMAVFGVPAVHEDDALRAVRAAQEMQDALPELGLEARIGINTGEVLAGDPAQGLGFVAGEAVIIAKRLEQGASTGEIIIGKATYALVQHAVSAGPLERIPVKGKAEDVGRRRIDEVDRDAPTRARRLDIPLVGRTEELAHLRQAFERSVDEGSCRLFTVLGPAGIGKSRLADELVGLLEPHATTAVGRCLPYGEGITFWPLTEIVPALGDVTEGLGDDAVLVLRLLAGLTGDADAVGSSEESFWAVRRAFEACAQRQPLVVFIEDLQWAEPTLLDLVEYVVGWSRNAAILVVCLARPELIERRPVLIAPHARRDALALEPLSAAESEALLVDLSKGTPLAGHSATRIAEAAGGNPLFLEQFAALAAEETNGADLLVPPSIQALLSERLDRLSTDERAVIERSAVIGRDFSVSAVACLAPEDQRPSLGQHLLALVRKGFVRPDPRSEREDRFSFDHVLIRDAAYAAMPKGLRAEMHERVADWAETTGTDELVGYHLERAYLSRTDIGVRDAHANALALRAGTKLGSAGRRAFARDDIPAAIVLLERAARLLEDDPERLTEVLIDLGSAVRETGNLTQAEDILEQATDMAGLAGREDLRHRALLELSGLRAFLDPSVGARDLLSAAQDAVAVFAGAGDELGLAKAWVHVSEACWLRARCAEMEEMLDRALVHAQRAGATREISWILGSACRAALLGPRPVDDAIRRCEEARAQGNGRLVVEAYAGAALAVLRAMQGQFEHAREQYGRTRALLEDVGLSVLVASMQMYPGMVELTAGDYEAAERELRSGYDALARMGDQGYLATMAAFLARALCSLGRLAEADELTRVSEEAASQDDLASQVMWRGARATVLVRTDRQGEAELLARKGAYLAEEMDMPVLRADMLVQLADVVEARQPDEASGIREQAFDLYRAKGNIAALSRYRVDLAPGDVRDYAG